MWCRQLPELEKYSYQAKPRKARKHKQESISDTVKFLNPSLGSPLLRIWLLNCMCNTHTHTRGRCIRQKLLLSFFFFLDVCVCVCVCVCVLGVILWLCDLSFAYTVLQRTSTFYSLLLLLFYFYLFIFCFLGPHPQHLEVPRLGSHRSCSCRPPPQPQQCGTWASAGTYTTAHGNARSLAGDWTSILMDTSGVCYCWITTGASEEAHFYRNLFLSFDSTVGAFLSGLSYLFLTGC